MVGERKEETECIGGAQEKETPEVYGELAQCRAVICHVEQKREKDTAEFRATWFAAAAELVGTCHQESNTSTLEILAKKENFRKVKRSENRKNVVEEEKNENSKTILGVAGGVT